MSVRTDANVISVNPLDPGAGNTMITRGTSNLKTMKVTINGEQYFVQTRYDKGDGTTAAVVVARTETQRTQVIRGSKTEPVTDKVDTPWVLFTTDSDGNTTFGGEGRTDDPESKVDIGPMHTTTEATAKAILATAEIDGFSATEAQVLAEHNVRTSTLHSNSRQIPDGPVNAGIPPVQGVTPIQATLGSVPDPSIPPVDPDKETELDSDDGKKPPNNDQENKEGKVLTQVKEKLGEAVDFLKLTPDKLEAFLSEMNSGDPIQKSSFYPIDNTFGMRNGQDYVTIDQFEYQSPRRDQIFGFEDDPLKNFTDGSQRITPLKKFVAQVKLPMPNRINDSNNVSWGNGDVMNNITAAIISGAMRNPAAVAAGGAAGGIIDTLLGTQGLGQIGALTGVAYNSTDGSLMDRFNQLAALGNGSTGAAMAARSTFQSMVLGMAGVNASPESILSRGAGVVPNANMELLFDTPTLRNFEFSWKMTPRDADEAAMVKAIIRFFKQGMAAKTLNNMAGERSLFLGAPNVFRLQYRTANGEIIEGVNRIKPCAVTGTSVDYTPDGVWSAYDGGQPVSTVLTIGMAELEPVYASDYSMDVIESRRSQDRISETFEQTETVFDGGEVTSTTSTFDLAAGDGDLYPIRPTEVGY